MKTLSAAIVFACALAMGLTARSEVRSIAVTGSTASSVTVSIGAGEAQNELWMVSGLRDCGETFEGWATAAHVGTVGASATEIEIPLPEQWGGKDTVLRFVLAEYRYDKMVKYIESSGAQYIDTQFTMDSTASATLRYFVPKATQNEGVFGARTGTQSKNISIGHVKANSVVLDYCNASYSTYRAQTSSGDPGTFDVYLGPDKRYVSDMPDGTNNTAWTGAAFTTDYTAYLFGRHDKVDGTGMSWAAATGMKLYSAAIQTNGIDACRFVPCVIGGVPALYDSVRKLPLFDGSGSATPFTAGPDVESEMPECALAVSEPFASVGRREVSVVGVCRSSGVEKFVLEVAPGAADQRLFVAYGKTDAGEEILSWGDKEEVGTVRAGQSRVKVAKPEGWGTSVTVARYFLEGETVLPHPYDKAVAYLESTGVQYIDTKITMRYPDAAELKFQSDTVTANTGIFGARTAAANKNISVGHTASMGVVLDYGTGDDYADYRESSGSKASGVFEVYLGPDRRQIDVGDIHKLNDKKWTDSLSTAQSAYLFGRHDTSGMEWAAAKIKLYSARIIRFGLYVRNFIPCVKDGTAKLYDAANNIFYDDISTSGVAFSAGPQVDFPTGKTVLAATQAVTPDMKWPDLTQGLFIVVE